MLHDCGAGAETPHVVRRRGITERTLCRKRKEYGGMQVAEAKRHKALVDENRQVRQFVVDKPLNLQVVPWSSRLVERRSSMAIVHTRKLDAVAHPHRVIDAHEEMLGDTLAHFVREEAAARRRLRTTNALEREHEERRRRTRFIRSFPSGSSYLRLAAALAADRSDQGAKRRYLIPALPTINAKCALKPPRAA